MLACVESMRCNYHALVFPMKPVNGTRTEQGGENSIFAQDGALINKSHSNELATCVGDENAICKTESNERTQYKEC